MGLFWIFGGAGEVEGGGRDFLATVHSLDEARAWLEAHPQTWAEIWVWREGRLHFEESYPPEVDNIDEESTGITVGYKRKKGK